VAKATSVAIPTKTATQIDRSIRLICGISSEAKWCLFVDSRFLLVLQRAN
jgi:hypothetical protein